MPPQFPSIQSFFQSTKSSSPPQKTIKSTSAQVGDGFTTEEVNAILSPSVNQFWTPPKEYEELEISALQTGPRCVTFMGRVVNLFDQTSSSKMAQAAKGCIKLMVRDDTGATMVKLWYANMQYQLRLGHLVTIWTPHISNSEAGSLALPTAPLYTSIFPERDRCCHIMIHENSDDGILCKTPLGYRDGHELTGLMTLNNFIQGGYDVSDSRILVCVKSIGARKKLNNKKGTTLELVNVIVFDDTAEATLTLWGSAVNSVSPWQVSSTVLLISNPGWRIERRAWISLTANTYVDLDPSMTDAEWLRAFAQRLTKRDHINPPFPEGAFDIEAAKTSPIRVLYTLAEVDEFIRAAPGETFTGYLSTIIMELNIMSLHRRNMLMCTECCGVPLYANATTATCKQCERPVPLSTNPRLLGPLVDETATTAAGKLILSPTAWAQLLGRSPEQLVNSSAEVLRYLEARLLFLRVTVCFAWVGGAEGMGRLCVWGVRV
ncbi:hypothetical protein M501DRAFT_992963 [Patellaria atrata CBS 101060]|uniref:Nucleic acid-binding protein n=1 Tax=Patellaria atrata CBS 101060 TaxID=1346257 RepID=A0A9P4S8L7_9PEZI|nr:hypothetical protein M501DRAFT_992963 [Patellaria atrata CBS 101060]